MWPSSALRSARVCAAEEPGTADSGASWGKEAAGVIFGNAGETGGPGVSLLPVRRLTPKHASELLRRTLGRPRTARACATCATRATRGSWGRFAQKLRRTPVRDRSGSRVIAPVPAPFAVALGAKRQRGVAAPCAGVSLQSVGRLYSAALSGVADEVVGLILSTATAADQAATERRRSAGTRPR
jgi:hypothetical protein